MVDQYGRILDGHNRKQIADNLGIETPVEVRHVADDAEAADLAVSLNCARRHLTREQVRHVVAAEIVRRPDDSDRAIARRVGCSPSTVGSVRKPQVSNLDSPAALPLDAEERTNLIWGHLRSAREAIAGLVWLALANNVPAAEVVMALTAAQRKHDGRSDRDVSQVFREAVFAPLIDAVMAPGNLTYFEALSGHEPFQPVSQKGCVELLTAIASSGIRERGDA